MIDLIGSELSIQLIDPIADAGRLGPRYCAGGYIWQVQDRKAGPLVSGPEWPNPTPSAFNGQGLPESFRHRTRAGHDLTWQGNRGIALGVGELAQETDGTVRIATPCQWELVRQPTELVFRTGQAALGFSYELERSVKVAGRTVTSSTKLTNRSSTVLALEWFAHPFFALTNREIQASVPTGTMLNENPGFVLSGTRLTQKRPFTHLTDGHMDFLQLPPQVSPTFRLNHPTLADVTFTTSFAPSECVIWGNNTTFSIEPYQKLVLHPQETREWHLRYDFGVAAKTA